MWASSSADSCKTINLRGCNYEDNLMRTSAESSFVYFMSAPTCTLKNLLFCFWFPNTLNVILASGGCKKPTFYVTLPIISHGHAITYIMIIRMLATNVITYHNKKNVRGLNSQYFYMISTLYIFFYPFRGTFSFIYLLLSFIWVLLYSVVITLSVASKYIVELSGQSELFLWYLWYCIKFKKVNRNRTFHKCFTQTRWSRVVFCQ